MGPRPEGHGEYSLKFWVVSLNMLQWGHVQKDMERTTQDVKVTLLTELQWGHVQKDMERSSSAYPNSSPRCFNGATSRRTWRESLAHPVISYLDVASMGPRPEGHGEH